MPCMPEIVAKGGIMRKLDAVMNDLDARKLLKDNLNNPAKRFVDAGDDVYAAFWENMLSDAEKTHMENDWFRPLDKGGWWCIEDGVVEKVLRKGLLTLIDRVELCCARWVDCYWVCAFQHDHNCHMYGGEVDDGDDPIFVITPEIDSGWLLRGGYPPQVMFPNDITLEKLKPKHVKLRPDENNPGAIPARFWDWWNGRWKKMQECKDIKADPKCEEGLDRVECSITWSHAQVTFSVHTPPPPNGYGVGAYMDFPEPIEVVKWDRAARGITVAPATWMGYEYK